MRCIRCNEELFDDSFEKEGEWIDKAWGEAICHPHDDPNKLHIADTKEGVAYALSISLLEHDDDPHTERYANDLVESIKVFGYDLIRMTYAYAHDLRDDEPEFTNDRNLYDVFRGFSDDDQEWMAGEVASTITKILCDFISSKVAP